jgi:hypothetical protein
VEVAQADTRTHAEQLLPDQPIISRKHMSAMLLTTANDDQLLSLGRGIRYQPVNNAEGRAPMCHTHTHASHEPKSEHVTVPYRAVRDHIGRSIPVRKLSALYTTLPAAMQTQWCPVEAERARMHKTGSEGI